MEKPDAPVVESDSRFPSGPWTGFFLQWWLPGRHTMALDLTFNGGQLEAHGSDPVGSFSFQGDYDRAEGKCRWIKYYHGKHHVTYSGVNEGEGIWGVWEIRLLGGLYLDQGVFHIWPRGMTPTAAAEATVSGYLSHQRARWLKRLGFVVLGGAAALATALLMRHLGGGSIP
jgi:hypothetical protein